MKPAPFELVAPGSVEEAVGLLGADSRVLAGGQSLVPLLNLRLARPARLVDINRIPELARLRRTGGTLLIGATVRQAALTRSPLVQRHWPLLAQAARHAGHQAIRSRGTVAGSVAHADPNAELPAALTALDARFHLRSHSGTRTLTSRELFQGPLTTAIAADELLTHIEVPPLSDDARTAFTEFAPTRGSFALAAVAAIRSRTHAAIAVTGNGSHPVRAGRAERALLEGASPDEAAELAAAEIDHPHRSALVRALAREAIAATAPRAGHDARGSSAGDDASGSSDDDARGASAGDDASGSSDDDAHGPA